MTGIVDWAADRARMVLAFIALSLIAGMAAYVSLPKEGEPDIEVPTLFVSVPFPGISAEDSEKLLVKPMETELSDLDGLTKMTGTAAEGYAGLVLEFEFGWDKTKILADVRDRMNTVEADFPSGAEKYSINEVNFSEFPIIIVNLSGPVPERTLLRVAKDLQDRIEGLDAVLEAGLAGQRDEMVEVVIDPLLLESYNVTAGELIDVVVNNNQLIAAGEVETESGAFAVKIPASFSEPRDIFELPIKTNGERLVTLGDLADIRLTFEDREGTARFNNEPTVALQVVKRKGFNLIDTAEEVRQAVEAERATWPAELQQAVHVGTSMDQSATVKSMVSQLEGSVLTAIALVMIVVLAALGPRPALLVGFAIPTSFLLCFVFLAIMDVAISNIVMFGLILAVGMLVDGAIVVVEYADRRIQEGAGPMHAYVEAAKRMFWPIVSSTATTLCAFLPMLFWPGIPGEFMGMLPVTLIFVLSASLVVALIYLPVMGGVAGRLSRTTNKIADHMRQQFPWWFLALVAIPPLLALYFSARLVVNPDLLLGPSDDPGILRHVPGAVMFIVLALANSVTLSAARIERQRRKIDATHRRTAFGYLIRFITGNPIMPIVTIFAVGFTVATVFSTFGENNRGVEFFVESEPEQALVYVRARGNLSVVEKDALVHLVEEVTIATPGVQSVFAFAGAGGLNTDPGAGQGPRDSIGQLQIELVPWDDRPRVQIPFNIFGMEFTREAVDPTADGNYVLDDLQARLGNIPGIEAEISELARGPASGKPVHLRIRGDNWDNLLSAAALARGKFEATPGLIDIEDTRPLPGIDWQIDVDVQKAGRFGADVATVGAMVQLVTRGVLLDTMRIDSSDEEIDIRVRLPDEDRVLATLDTMKVRTRDGLVPLSNFITRTPVEKLGQIDRFNQSRYFDIKADVTSGLVSLVPPDGAENAETRIVNAEAAKTDPELIKLIADEGLNIVPINPNERITALTEWLQTDQPLGPGIDWEWTGDQEEQAESGAFLQNAFMGALFLMFIILLAQFNSFYNAILVLLAVILSTTGVLVGMLVMEQPFSIIMTGTGIVALAGIVVNNNIVLIDTYQEFSRYMPRIEAIICTAEQRIRPVLLTTITTMAGLTPMMFGLSIDFFSSSYSVDSPTALWWKQLATAVVFGLGIATLLTLIFTPAMLALRVWFWTYVRLIAAFLARLSLGSASRVAQDWALRREARRLKKPEVIWDESVLGTGHFLPAEPVHADVASDWPTDPNAPMKAAE
ncbi:MAG: efflux RND transporter permease subunit [Pseudomonadota bacterium]